MVDHQTLGLDYTTSECGFQALASSVEGVAGASVCPRITSVLDPSVVISSTSSGVPRLSKAARLARKASWMKRAGGYLNLASFYFAAPDDEELLRNRLDFCLHTWFHERKGDLLRYRGVGCGDRVVCPVCASYYQSTLADDAVKCILAAQDGVEIGEGVKLLSFGLKLETTLPAVVSERLDALLLVDGRAWRDEQSKFLKLTRDLIAWSYGQGAQVGGIAGNQYSGESAPCDPHYHSHNYIFPAVRRAGVWSALPRLSSQAEIKALRDTWTMMLNEAYGLDLQESDLHVGYLPKVTKLSHYLHYLYRPLLADLWAGWSGVEDGDVDYRHSRGRKRLLLAPDALARLACRVRSIPFKFKRIRSFGFFSDGQRGATMRSLGLEPVEVDEDGQVSSSKWERVSINRFVRYVREGVVLRQVLCNGNGDVLRDEVEGADGWPVFRERLGPAFIVLNGALDYRPSGVNIGKRKRWQTPGSIKGV